MNNENPKEVVLQVGAVLKKIRRERKLSIEELAEIAGVSKLTLGNIERGDTNPTIGVLWKLSRSLSIPLMSLFANEKEVSVSRAGEGVAIAEDGENWVVEPISQGSPDLAEVYRAYLQPQSTYIPEKHHANTTEFVTVMAGEVIVKIDGTSYDLSLFDAIRFRGDLTHSYINETDEVAVLHIVLNYGNEPS